MFELKSHVVYPGHGVALVEDIIERTVSGTVLSFLKLSFIFKDMTILVPLYNVASIGIRQPSSEQEVINALNELEKVPEKRLESIDFTPSGWNRRHKEYQAKIQSGNIFEIAKIYRDLMHIAQQKELSFGERNVLQVTEELVMQEIQIVKNIPQDDVIQLLRLPFKRFTFYERMVPHQEATTPTL